MELGPRNRLSQAFVKEEQDGNTFLGPHGTYVYLDIRHLGENLIDARLPFVRELTPNYAGVSPANELIPVRPFAHPMMGWIVTDIQAAPASPRLTKPRSSRP